MQHPGSTWARILVAAAAIAALLALAPLAAADTPRPRIIAATEPKAPPQGREADAIIALLQSVAADYGNAVQGDVALDESRHALRVRLLSEAIRLAESAKLSGELRERLASIRRRVEARGSPSEIYETCRSAIPDVVAELWASMTPPAPGRLDEAAAVYAERCASCHGASGDGNGPRSADLHPPPRSLLDPWFVDLLSPYRAFHAISFGMQGTAMPSYDGLREEERWALSFYVLSLRHAAQDAGEGERALARAHLGLPSLEELALRSDRDLAVWLAARVPAADVAPAIVYLRTAGVADAGATPFEEIRRELREAARAYATDPARASAIAAEAARRFAELAPEVMRRDRVVGAGVEDVLRRLSEAIADRAPGAEVQAIALRAFSAVGGAQAALSRPPRTGVSAAIDAIPRAAQVALATAVVMGGLLIARYQLRRAGPSGSGPAEESRGGGKARVPVWVALLAAGLLIAAAFVARQAMRGN